MNENLLGNGHDELGDTVHSLPTKLRQAIAKDPIPGGSMPPAPSEFTNELTSSGQGGNSVMTASFDANSRG